MGRGIPRGSDAAKQGTFLWNGGGEGVLRALPLPRGSVGEDLTVRRAHRRARQTPPPGRYEDPFLETCARAWYGERGLAAHAPVTPPPEGGYQRRLMLDEIKRVFGRRPRPLSPSACQPKQRESAPPTLMLSGPSPTTAREDSPGNKGGAAASHEPCPRGSGTTNGPGGATGHPPDATEGRKGWKRGRSRSTSDTTSTTEIVNVLRFMWKHREREPAPPTPPLRAREPTPTPARHGQRQKREEKRERRRSARREPAPDVHRGRANKYTFRQRIAHGRQRAKDRLKEMCQQYVSQQRVAQGRQKGRGTTRTPDRKRRRRDKPAPQEESRPTAGASSTGPSIRHFAGRRLGQETFPVNGNPAEAARLATQQIILVRQQLSREAARVREARL